MWRKCSNLRLVFSELSALQAKAIVDGLGKNYANFTSSCQYLSIIYLRAVNSHRFNQSDLDTRSWYHGTAASMECLQALLRKSSSPDCYRFIPFALDCTRLSPTGACSQAISQHNIIKKTTQCWRRKPFNAMSFDKHWKTAKANNKLSLKRCIVNQMERWSWF